MAQENVKEILRQMAAELIDLRASVDVLGGALPARPSTLGDALDSKSQAIANNKKAYAKLLAKIEKL
jgi:hypothetical protein